MFSKSLFSGMYRFFSASVDCEVNSDLKILVIGSSLVLELEDIALLPKAVVPKPLLRFS